MYPAPRKRVCTCVQGHSNWVTGLAWDPLDKFLVSSGTDNKSVVWDTHDWTIKRTFVKPFEVRL